MSGSLSRWGGPAVALLTAVVATGCGGSGGLDTRTQPSSSTASEAASSSAAAPESSSPPTTATVDPAAAAESAVAADYRHYDKGLTRSLRTRNARVIELIRFSTPQRQAKDRGKIQTMRQRGIVYQGTPRSWVGPVSVVGNRATLHVCERDDASWYEQASSGRLVGTRLDRWNPYEVRVLKRDGRWQVNLVTASKKISCKGAQ